MSESKSDSLIIKVSLAFLPALAAFIGVVYATQKSDESNRNLAKIDKFQAARFVAYGDFANARRRVLRAPEDKEAEIAMEQAATRIVVYGEEPVVRAIAETWRVGGPSQPCSKGQATDLAIYAKMRGDVFGTQLNSHNLTDIAEVLYRCKFG